MKFLVHGTWTQLVTAALHSRNFTNAFDNPFSKNTRLLSRCAYRQAISVSGCSTRRLPLLGKKPVLICSSPESSAPNVPVSKYSARSNAGGSGGWTWLLHSKLQPPTLSRKDRVKGKNRRWRTKAAANCQVEIGAQIGSPTSKPEGAGRLFIFGFGFTSSALAIDLKSKSWIISGTCRSCEVRSKLENCGFRTFLFNSDNDGEEVADFGLQELQQATHWLVSVPPVGDFDKDPVLAVHRGDLIQAAGRGNVRWIGYLSSTGVYGDWQGEWVDEDTLPRPAEQKAVARLAAEKDWLDFGETYDVAVQVFRLGGIYGAGRNAFTTILQNRTLTRLQRERRRFTSRIHVADVCQVVTASMANPCRGRIYNVVDDDPAPRREVFAFARELLAYQVRDTEATEGAATIGDIVTGANSSSQFEEKRVSNRRIKEELHIQLLHPSYKSGLREIMKNSLRTKTQ